MGPTGARMSNKASENSEHHQDSPGHYWATHIIFQLGMSFQLMVLSYFNTNINFMNLRSASEKSKS